MEAQAPTRWLGGAGNDTYVVDSSGDVVTEGASAGTDTVESTITLHPRRKRGEPDTHWFGRDQRHGEHAHECPYWKCGANSLTAALAQIRWPAARATILFGG